MEVTEQCRPWYATPELKQLPFESRVWIWWCAHGPKRLGGGTFGGNHFFRILRGYLHSHPRGKQNFQAITIDRWNRDLVVDLLDFETYQHTLPVASRRTDEMVLQALLLRPDSVYIDVGANQGLFSLHASSLIGIEGRILSIEPNPRLAEALRRTQSVNQLNQMLVIQSAVGNRSGDIDFFVPLWSSGVGSFFEAQAAQASSTRRMRVTVDTLDDIVKRSGLATVDLIKVDVEGAEMQVFQGAVTTLRTFHPHLWFEVNLDALRRGGSSAAGLLEFLAEQGYGAVYDLAGIVAGRFHGIGESDMLANAVAVHKDRVTEFRTRVVQRSRGLDTTRDGGRDAAENSSMMPTNW